MLIVTTETIKEEKKQVKKSLHLTPSLARFHTSESNRLVLYKTLCR